MIASSKVEKNKREKPLKSSWEKENKKTGKKDHRKGAKNKRDQEDQ